MGRSAKAAASTANTQHRATLAFGRREYSPKPFEEGGELFGHGWAIATRSVPLQAGHVASSQGLKPISFLTPEIA